MIEVSDLYKSFDQNHVLRGVNLKVHDGKSMVIIGASGQGKSVILKCLLGLIKPNSGKITFNELNIGDCFDWNLLNSGLNAEESNYITFINCSLQYRDVQIIGEYKVSNQELIDNELFIESTDFINYLSDKCYDLGFQTYKESIWIGLASYGKTSLLTAFLGSFTSYLATKKCFLKGLLVNFDS